MPGPSIPSWPGNRGSADSAVTEAVEANLDRARAIAKTDADAPEKIRQINKEYEQILTSFVQQGYDEGALRDTGLVFTKPQRRPRRG